MGLDDPTDDGSRPTSPDDPVMLLKGRFLAALLAGSSPRIEDYLDGLTPANRAWLLRELIVAERDWMRARGMAVDPADYLARFPGEGKLIDEVLGEDEPTVTISLRDRGETETCLLFGLLTLANGLIEPASLVGALGDWAVDPGRTLRDVLVERGLLDESDASMISALVAKHLEQHHGIAWESLIALGRAVRFRLDPSEVADSELRVILAEFVEAEPPGAPPEGLGGFGPRYEVLRHHARGGLGTVSLALDKELHREVAVKEIRDDCADNPDYRARFLREAEVTGRLEHPGIVPVYGRGYHDDGRPYYIMRFIRGETLKAAIHRLHKVGVDGEDAGLGERHDLHSLVGRFVDACHAIAYAHHRKVLHRDIKPINIMLGPFGETLVVDWGLAKTFEGPRSGEHPTPAEEATLRPESGSELTPTRDGSQVGTTGYMSPEQAAGRLLELGPTSDIYSLGVTLYYLATGHAPFEGAGREEFLRRVREGDFARPSKVNPDIPRPLEAICLKAMALRPIDRYQTVADLIDDLERWSAGSPVNAYPEPILDRLARRARKHRTPLAAAAVLLLCGTIGLAAYAANERRYNLELTAAWGRADAGRQEANKRRAESEDSRKAALRHLRSILREVEGADLTFLARSETLRERMANDLIDSYRELLRGDPLDMRMRSDLSDAYQVAANIARSTGQFDRARGHYAGSIRLREALRAWDLGRGHAGDDLARLRNDAGENFRMAGKPGEAVEEYRLGLKALRKSSDPRVEARLQLDLSTALVDLGKLDEAEGASLRAIGLVEPLAEGTPIDREAQLLLIYARLGRGGILRLGGGADASGQLAEAESLARNLMAAIPDPDTRFALAAVRGEQGLLRQADPAGSKAGALDAFQEAHAILESLCDHLPGTIEFRRTLALVLNGRGRCFLDSGKLEEARADFSKAWGLLERLDGIIPDHFQHLGLLAWTLANLGRTSDAEGNSDAPAMRARAAEYHRRAAEFGPDSPFIKGLRSEIQP